jgi:hypothetical protein
MHMPRRRAVMVPYVDVAAPAAAREGAATEDRWRNFALPLTLPANMRDDGRLVLPETPTPYSYSASELVRLTHKKEGKERGVSVNEAEEYEKKKL